MADPYPRPDTFRYPHAQPPSPLMDDLGRGPAGWPKVIGIISIVWSGVLLTCGACGLGWAMIMPRFMQDLEKQMGGPMPAVMQPQPAQLGVGAISLAWTVLLLIAGILLLTRKPVARPLHLIYAAGAVVLGVAGIVFQVQQQAALAEWVRLNPTDPWAKQLSSSPMGNAGAIIGLIFGIVFGLAWPAFLLIWFGAIKRNSAEIAAGVEPLTA